MTLPTLHNVAYKVKRTTQTIGNGTSFTTVKQPLSVDLPFTYSLVFSFYLHKNNIFVDTNVYRNDTSTDAFFLTVVLSGSESNKIIDIGSSWTNKCYLTRFICGFICGLKPHSESNKETRIIL